MRRINNGNWVNQHRKIQGEFQNKQDIEAYLFDKKLSNGNNIQENNRLNTDDLPNIPAILDYETNLSRQRIIEPIDGGRAHTPTTQAILSTLTALSVILPNITASSKKAISTDSQNCLSSTVKSFTEVSKTPIFFNTTSATTPTSQNHDKLEEPTKHNDNQSFIRVKRSNSSTEYVVPLHQEYACDATIDTKIITQKLQEGNIHTLFVRNLHKAKTDVLMSVIKDNNINVLTLMDSDLYIPLSINASYIQEIARALKGTKIEELFLVHHHNGDSTAINIIESIKKVDAKVKILNLSNNSISNQGAENIASKLRDTQITEVCLTKNKAITPKTLQKIFMVLEDNKDVDTTSIEPHAKPITQEPNTTLSNTEAPPTVGLSWLAWIIGGTISAVLPSIGYGGYYIIKRDKSNHQAHDNASNNDANQLDLGLELAPIYGITTGSSDIDNVDTIYPATWENMPTKDFLARYHITNPHRSFDKLICDANEQQTVLMIGDECMSLINQDGIG